MTETLLAENEILKRRVAELEAERDAAINDVKDAARYPCMYCRKNNEQDCDCWTAYDKWEWRGVER